ncbi:MAG: tRNA 4-thiouridine(8) synthase ThiI, partial [Lachnospiraceae bacterium]|nr:tRNA 4-thiouridine(8) synthase ThiI [Lachnospiraceae bacterium]
MEGTLDYRWQKNGMALGGIGAGSVEICQNGELREWDICNMGKWGSPDVRKQKKIYDYDAHVLPFTVRAKLAGKEPVVRRLCHDRDNGEFRSLMYSWYKEIEKICWNPDFPVCRLQYEDSGLPIKIEAEFASPFVPGQEAIAGTPGFYVTFTITNPSDQEAEVSILGKLKNPVNRGTEQRRLRNQLTAEKGCAQIVMKSDSKKANASNGSLAWSVSADEVSWILGEFEPYFTNYVMSSRFGVTEESYLFDFRDTGKLPNLGTETLPEFGTELTEEEISLMDEQELDAIFAACQDYLGDDIACAKSFKVESKRADKRFPLNSIQISQEIGGRLAEAYPEVAVDVHNPDYTVYVEVREERAFVHGPAEPGAGGLPVGVGGKTALLLSGGIDSPVAGYMMAKRGVELECVHFFSYPYTSERAKEKVLDLARIMTRYCGRITVHVVPFTKIQEEIRDNCPEEYFTLIMRRMMMRISEALAEKLGCMSLTTGESLGQVASQTMQAMMVTNAVCSLPVFRPVIGMDKEEIIAIARKIETMETSILPYEDCCT